MIPIHYVYRNFVARRLTSAVTVAGIALVVFVFAAVLMMAFGIQKTLVTTGDSRNAIIARKSAQGEISSIIDRETTSIILSLAGIAKSNDGKPLASTEPVAIINLRKKNDGGLSNVTVRGVSQTAFELRPTVRITSGRMFRPGSRELIVGKSIESRFDGAQIGSQIRFAGDVWTIVGMFEAAGSGFESEMWLDTEQILAAFNRNAFSTITFRTNGDDGYDLVRAAFEKEQRLQQFEVLRENEFFAKQSEMMSTFIRILGIFITIIFSVGAIIGAAITMYAAVANRRAEIGTLRALGFRRRNIMTAFLLESLLISVVGGLAGLGLASFLQFFEISTLNFGSFSELTFSFALSPSIALNSMFFAIIMGMVGGFFPAFRASRMKILDALRAA